MHRPLTDGRIVHSARPMDSTGTALAQRSAAAGWVPVLRIGGADAERKRGISKIPQPLGTDRARAERRFPAPEGNPWIHGRVLPHRPGFFDRLIQTLDENQTVEGRRYLLRARRRRAALPREAPVSAARRGGEQTR